jgi:hypothetical protein
MSVTSLPSNICLRAPARHLARGLARVLRAWIAMSLAAAGVAAAAPPPGPQSDSGKPAASLSCDEAFSGTQNARKSGNLIRAKELATQCIQACPAFARADCVRWTHEIDDATPTIVFRIEGAPDAATFIDDKLVAEHLDGRAIAVEPGRHIFRAQLVSGEVQSVELVISEGDKRKGVSLTFGNTSKPKRLPATLAKDDDVTQPERGTLHPLVWAGGATLLAGSLLGTIAGGVALAKAGDVRNNCPNKTCPPPYHGTLDAVSTWSTISTTAFVVASAGLVALIVGFALPAKSTKVGFLRMQGTF